MASWAEDAVFYHFYPLGFCGAPAQNDFSSPPEPRLDRIYGWLDHLQALGVTALYLGPVFESSTHAYETADYYWVDRRLGTNETLKNLIAELHRRGLRVILDGVFNHVGRDFWAFRECRAQGGCTPYAAWFHDLRLGGRSPYGDPFTYAGWNGCHNLVKLNLTHPDVRAHLFEAVATWVREFDIDGLRLDAADCLEPGFIRELAALGRRLKPDFWQVGEIIHGDYRRWAGEGLLDSVTNYEVYKGLYSSHNDRNYFELAHTAQRQFGAGGLYRGLSLYNFADNHDVDRVASRLKNPAHLYPLYALLFTLPGVPSVYYGSEWGLEGSKLGPNDAPMRPSLISPETARAAAPHPDLAPVIARLAGIRAGSEALRRGEYTPVHLASQQYVFSRRFAGETVLVAVNAAPETAALEVPRPPDSSGRWEDLLNPGEGCESGDRNLKITVPANWARILRRDR